MALYPQAVKKLLPENKTQGRINPTQIILHSAVDAPGPTSLYGFFGRADVTVESHFFIKLDGTVEQYMDTNVRADANRFANVRAVSIETEDDGNPDQRPWSDAQLSAMKRLMDWLFVIHPIYRRVCPAWDLSGVGYHTMWGAPSQWTPVKKSCPGAIRIAQFKNVLVPWLEGSDKEDKEVEMVILAAPGRPAALLSGSEMVQFADQSTLGALTSAGIETVSVSQRDYDLFNQGFNKNI